MKIYTVSDLHLEFFSDSGDYASSLLDKIGVGANPKEDVLVIAGDLGFKHNLETALKILSPRFLAIIYVPGNHDYYHYSMEEVRGVFRRIKIKNVHILDRGTVTIGGQGFVGATLWFPYQETNEKFEKDLSDFSYIKDFNFYGENRLDQAFLEREVFCSDIVVTHHMPSLETVAPQYKKSPMNCFFVTQMDDLIHRMQPRAWIFGHTHDSFQDLWNFHTKLICNPYGYHGREVNKKFDPQLYFDPREI